jgi:hypothetical protein
MNGRMRRSLWIRKGIPLAIGFVALGFGGTDNAGAAPIRRQFSRDDVVAIRSWSRYLLGGESAWNRASTPAITPAVRNLIWGAVNSAEPLNNAMVQYLVWRRELRPFVFDFYHPRLGTSLAQLLEQPPVSAPPTGSPSAGPTPSSPQGITPPSVPEPTALLTAIGLTAWGLWSRHRLLRARATPGSQAG